MTDYQLTLPGLAIDNILVAYYRVVIPNGTVDQGNSSISGTIAWHINDLAGATGDITMAAGTYYIQTRILIPGNITIRGLNSPTINVVDEMNDTLFEFIGSYIVIDGININGNASNQTLVGNSFFCETNGVNNITIKNCNIDGIFGYGFQVDAVVSEWDIHNNKFENCGLSSYDVSRAAISFQTATDTFQNINVYNNYIDTCGAGIQFYSNSGGSITNIQTNFNKILNVETVPIEYNSTGINNSTVIGNIIKGSGTNGISGYFNGTIISDNNVEDQTNYGIEFTSGGTVIGNIIKNCGNGIRASGASSNFVITGNKIHNTTIGTNHDAIRFDQAVYSNGLINNNLIIDPHSAGITITGTGTLGDVTNISIDNNTIIFKAPRTSGQEPTAVQIYDADDISVSYNKITVGVSDPSGAWWHAIIDILRDSKNVHIKGNEIIGR